MSWFTNLFKSPPAEEPHCVPLSIMCAWTWGVKRHEQVRIAITRVENGNDHAQAEAMIDGEWVPLRNGGTGGT